MWLIMWLVTPMWLVMWRLLFGLIWCAEWGNRPQQWPTSRSQVYISNVMQLDWMVHHSWDLFCLVCKITNVRSGLATGMWKPTPQAEHMPAVMHHAIQQSSQKCAQVTWLLWTSRFGGQVMKASLADLPRASEIDLLWLSSFGQRYNQLSAMQLSKVWSLSLL